MAHIPDDDDMQLKPYQVMLRCFSELVLVHKLFAYQAFGFEDENADNRVIGDRRARALLFAEKRGWMRWLRQQHAEREVSVVALGGAPSALSSEYTARELRAVVGDDEVHMIGLVNYDPAGWVIARAFRDQLILSQFMPLPLVDCPLIERRVTVRRTRIEPSGLRKVSEETECMLVSLSCCPWQRRSLPPTPWTSARTRLRRVRSPASRSAPR